MKDYWLFPVRVAAILVVCTSFRLAAASWWYLAMAGAYPRLEGEEAGFITTTVPHPRASASASGASSAVSVSMATTISPPPHPPPPMIAVTPDSSSATSKPSRSQVVVAVKGGKRRQQLLRLACSDLPYLGQRQRELCALDRSLIHIIGRGAHMGIQECQHQFRDRRWNCSTFNEPSVFGNILSIQSRETAFIYAISSAGVMYSVTRACSKGQLLRCTCDARVGKRHATDGTFEWGGCSDNVRFGSRFSKDFVDSNEQPVTAQGMMNLWNNGAGRKTTKESLEVLCKCHGVSGSCSVKICWRKLEPFRAIGAKLKAKFDGASLVLMDGKRRRLKRVTRHQKQPRKSDLVYLRESPDFCQLNREVGSLGTHGRRCNKTSYGLDGCTLMCCGRGYHTLVRTEKESCDCKFHWCCSVECKECTRVREMNYCN